MNNLLIGPRKLFFQIVFQFLFEIKTAYYPPLAGAGYSALRNFQAGVDYAATTLLLINRK
jgi:hypothetical protein